MRSRLREMMGYRPGHRSGTRTRPPTRPQSQQRRPVRRTWPACIGVATNALMKHRLGVVVHLLRLYHPCPPRSLGPPPTTGPGDRPLRRSGPQDSQPHTRSHGLRPPLEDHNEEYGRPRARGSSPRTTSKSGRPQCGPQSLPTKLACGIYTCIAGCYLVVIPRLSTRR